MNSKFDKKVNNVETISKQQSEGINDKNDKNSNYADDDISQIIVNSNNMFDFNLESTN